VPEAELEITLTEQARTWKLPAKLVDRSKPGYVKDTSMNLDDFKGYLQGIKGQDPASADSYALRTSYFFGMFEVKPPTFSGAAFMSKFYTSKLAQTWLQLDLVSPSIPKPQNLLTAVKHYLDYLLLDCNRQQDNVALRDLTLLKAEFVQPQAREQRKFRKAREAKNKHKKADKLRKLPPVPVLQAALKEAMIDLAYASKLAQKCDTSEWKLKGVANCIMCGLVFFNSYAGRPGGWSSFRRALVEELVEKQCWFSLLAATKPMGSMVTWAGLCCQGTMWQ